MDIPITSGFITTSYNKLMKILGEPNFGQLNGNNNILVRWNIRVSGYYLYVLDENEIDKSCEWYIGDKDVNWLFSKKDLQTVEDSMNKLKDKNSMSKFSSSIDNANQVIKSLIYYSY